MKNKRIYLWEGLNHQGKKVTGEVESYSLNLARFEMSKKIPHVLDVRKKKNFLFKREKLTNFELVMFFRQLATLLVSGISLSQALLVLQGQADNAYFEKILQSLSTDIVAGKTFSSALEKFPKHFDSMTCHLIAAGEKSGTLDNMVSRLGHDKEKIFKLRRKLLQALLYPFMITLMMVLVSLIMLIVIIPRFAEFFQSAHCALPFLTRLILKVSEIMRNYGYCEVGGALLIGASIYYLSRQSGVKQILDRWCLQVPILHLFLKKWILTHFSRNLATLLVAAIPLNEALRMSAALVSYHPYITAIQQLEVGVLAGKPLNRVMYPEDLFLPMLRHLVQIGEESGTLEKMLEKSAEFYEADIDHFLEYINRFLEPLIMILLGVLIGGLVMAMYLPIFRLGITV